MPRSGSIEIMLSPRAPCLKLLKWLPTAHTINSEMLPVVQKPCLLPSLAPAVSPCSDCTGLPPAQFSRLPLTGAFMSAALSPWHSPPSTWPRQPLLLIQIAASLTLIEAALESPIRLHPPVTGSQSRHPCHYLHICNGFLTACSPKGRHARGSPTRFKCRAVGFP